MRYIALVLGILFINACQNSRRQKNEKLTTMEFSIVDSLLSENYADSTLQIKFRVPKDFVTCEYKEMGLRKQKIDSIVPYHLKILKLFANKNEGSLIILSSLDSLNIKDYDLLIANFQDKLNSMKIWDISYAPYQYNGFIIDQFVLKSTKYINLKLLFYKGVKRKFQMDLIVPYNKYNTIAKSIESYIGSINKITNFKNEKL